LNDLETNPSKALIATLFLGGVAGAVTLAISGTGEAMEDAAIHLAMAKNFWSEGFFSLTQGTPAGAVTSPLWVFLEALILGPTGSPEVTVTVLSLFTYGLFSWSLWKLLEGHSRELALITLLLAWVSGPFQWHLWSGMETLLFAGFVLGALDATLRKEDLKSGLWAGAAILTRMEGILLLGVIGLALWRRFRAGEPPKTNHALGMGFGVAAFGLFGLINWAHTGHFMPTTGAGKRFLYGIMWHGVDAIPIVHTRVMHLVEDWILFMGGAYGKNGIFGLFWLSVLALPLGYWTFWKARSSQVGILLFWCVILTGVYALELPVRDVAGRYQSLNLLLLPIGMAGAVLGASSIHRMLGALLLVLFLVQQGSTVLPWAHARHTQHEHLESVHREAGLWIQQNNPECKPIILGEIGWISYENKQASCPAPIRDYYALADPEYFREASAGKAFSAALNPGDEGIFALSMLSTNLPSVHLRLRFPDGEPGTWKQGETYTAIEETTERKFRFHLVKRFSYSFPENPKYKHPAGRITGMNPLLVGRIQAQ